MKKILLTISKLFLFILIMINISIIVFYHSGKNLINVKNLTSYIEKSEILNMNANLIFKLEDDKITLKEKIYEIAIESNIPKEIALDILKSEEINILLGDYFNKIIYYLVKDNEKPIIEESTLKKIKDISLFSLEDHLNIMISEDEFIKYIEDFCNRLVSITPNKQEMIGTIPLSFIKNFLNFKPIVLYFNLIILIILYYFIYKKFYKLLKILGLALISVGVCFVILGSLTIFIDNLLLSYVSSLKILISPLIRIFLTILFKYGVLISFIGLFLSILYIILNRINNN